LSVKIRRSPANIVLIILGGVLMVLFWLGPMSFAILNSFKSEVDVLSRPLSLPSSFKTALDNYFTAWTKSNYLRLLGNSTYTTVVGVAVTVFVSSLAGYKIARTRTRYSGFFLVLFTLSMMVPFQALMIPLSFLSRSLGLYDRLLTLPLFYMGGIALAVLLYSNYVNTVPLELEEAAIMDGCASFWLFYKVVFPLLKPISATIMVLYSLRFWNNVILPLIILRDTDKLTVPTALWHFTAEYANQWNYLLAAGIIGVLPLLILFLSAQKFVISGLTSGAMKF
jgi:raffinose/stachyose/melibiose transport system permease protein